MPLGSLKLHHSRESLEYNKSTQKVLAKKLLQVIDEIQVIAKQKLADSNDLWDAKRNYAKIVNAMPYQMRGVFENAFEWNGIKITSPDFSRDYQLQDDLIITHSWKETDSDSRDGYKVRSQKMNRAICQDNYLFLIQDLESSHGNNLRVRTLMEEDESLEGVYIILLSLSLTMSGKSVRLIRSIYVTLLTLPSKSLTEVVFARLMVVAQTFPCSVMLTIGIVIATPIIGKMLPRKSLR
jgi:hypothetical protein